MVIYRNKTHRRFDHGKRILRRFGIAQTTVRFSGSKSWISISFSLFDSQHQDPSSVKRACKSNTICGFEKKLKIVEIKCTLDRGKHISRRVQVSGRGSIIVNHSCSKNSISFSISLSNCHHQNILSVKRTHK